MKKLSLVLLSKRLVDKRKTRSDSVGLGGLALVTASGMG